MAKQASDFPWHIGVFDAHCHPTDTMSSISSIPRMKTRVLTVMATRSQDQTLVSEVAEKYYLKSEKMEEWGEEECVVPCFGWHPWFSYQMYIDDEEELESGGKGKRNGKEESSEEKILQGEQKLKHYQRVLRPSRESLSEDDIRIFNAFPDPTPFSHFLAETKSYLQKYPYALIGEIGLDRSFRIPEPPGLSESEVERNSNLTPGGREGRRLTPFRVDIAHQKQIVKLQLQLAAEMGRAVSMHGVQAHGVVFEVIKEMYKGYENKVQSKRERKKNQKLDPNNNEEEAKTDFEERKPYPPRICLHSYSGNPSSFKQYLDPSIPIEIFASFSTAINLSDMEDGETPKSFEEMVKTVPDRMVLVESDLHVAGEEMDRRLEDIVRRVCAAKGWGVEEGVQILKANWRRFVFGEKEKGNITI